MPLQRCNICFSNYISDIGYQAMRKVVRCLIEGITDSEELLKCAHTRTKNKHGTDMIRESLNGVVTQVDQEMLSLYMEELELSQECVIKMMELCDQGDA